MLQIRLFGRCSLESIVATDSPQTIPSAKARELLGYLACHPNRDLSRNSVIATLWGDTQEDQGRRYLRHTLWQIHNTLKLYKVTLDRPFIEAEGDWIHLHLHPEISFDVIRFERLCKESFGATSQRMIPLPSFQELTSLYRGPFLESCYQDWCIQERERFQKMYLELLGRMMDQEFNQGRTEAAFQIAREILSVDAATEAAHWTIMSYYHRLGDRISALRQYQECKKILRDELDVTPGEKLNALRDLVHHDSVDNSIVSLPVLTENDYRSDLLTTLQEIQEQVKELRRDIQEIKQQVHFHSPLPEKDVFTEKDFTSD